MQVHLVDGTYELFRYFFAMPSHVTAEGIDIAAARGVLGTCLQILEEGATHVGIATDHVIESFRNEMLDSYKDGSGVDPILLTQFPIVEELLVAAGFCVWPMVEYEADDAMASAAAIAALDPAVDRVIICTPDKDLGQCITDDGKVVHGIPGIPGWGAKSTGAVLARYGHLEAIPASPGQWDVPIRGAAKLAAALQLRFEDALLYRRLATVEVNAPTVTSVAEIEWRGPTSGFGKIAARYDSEGMVRRAERLASRR
jgi:5'-3' exonuclease